IAFFTGPAHRLALAEGLFDEILLHARELIGADQVEQADPLQGRGPATVPDLVEITDRAGVVEKEALERILLEYEQPALVGGLDGGLSGLAQDQGFLAEEARRADGVQQLATL